MSGTPPDFADLYGRQGGEIGDGPEVSHAFALCYCLVPLGLVAVVHGFARYRRRRMA